MLRHSLQYKSIWEILLSNLSLNVLMDSHSSITSAVQILSLEVFRGRNKTCPSSADVQDSLEHVTVFCKLWNCFLAVKSRDLFFSLGPTNVLISTFCVLTKAIFILFTPTFLAYLQKKHHIAITTILSFILTLALIKITLIRQNLFPILFVSILYYRFLH